MLPDDLQHEQFLMVQARASGVDWRPASGYVRRALLACAEIAATEGPTAGRAARHLPLVEPLAWAASDDEPARFSVLVYAPEGDVEPEEREHLAAARTLFAGVAGAALAVHVVRDDGEVALLE